jgi:hypothetical protein
LLVVLAGRRAEGGGVAGVIGAVMCNVGRARAVGRQLGLGAVPVRGGGTRGGLLVFGLVDHIVNNDVVVVDDVIVAVVFVVLVFVFIVIVLVTPV